jgi:rsbT co-antagonist protein RsbR
MRVISRAKGGDKDMLHAADGGAGARGSGEGRSSVDRLEREIARLEMELAEMRAVEAELRAMFQAMNDVVMVLDADGRYLKVAPTAPNLLYRPGDEVVGRTMHEIMPAESADFFLDKVREALAARRVVTFEYSLPIQDQQTFFVGTISPMSEDTVIFVARDVSELKRAEARQRAMQEEIIRAQQAALAELQTPLVPISDSIMAMPLVGTLDAVRMDRVMTALLEGVQARGVRAAILDITGVPTVNEVVAQSLVAVARAVQLLGAQVILTGLRTEVARTLATLGVDLRGIITRGTLQGGIAWAMASARG